MKHLRPSFITAMVFLLVLAACAPPFPSSQPLAPAVSQAAVSVEPTDAGVPETGQVAPTLQPVVLPAPAMAVGSLFRYFDGSLLDAVPDEGPFTMGGDGLDNPRHEVTVKGFWIYSTEVTNQMYAWCVNLGKCSPPKAADNPGFTDPLLINHPVVGVTWQQAADYCGFAHGRLPTEAEWEKAAGWDAAARQQRLYPWGDHRPTCDLLNFKYCLNKTAPVVNYGQGRSYYGLLNMAGNVFEWVGDWYGRNYYGSSPDQNPTGPDSGAERVVRSSAFASDGYMSETSRRSFAWPGDHRSDLGFRCVVEDPSYFAPYCAMPVFYGAAAPAADGSTIPASQPCPDPQVTMVGYCGDGKTPVVNVRVHSEGPTITTVTGLEACNPANNALDVAHQCPLGTSVQVQASCPVDPAGEPACPPNYRPDPNDPRKCISPGGPGACPQGFEYDEALQCCSAVPGSSAASPLCAVGQHLYNGTCVLDDGGPRVPRSLSFTTATGLTCNAP